MRVGAVLQVYIRAVPTSNRSTPRYFGLAQTNIAVSLWQRPLMPV